MVSTLNIFIIILLVLVIYLAVSKYCIGLSAGQCSTNISLNFGLLLKYIVTIFWNIVKGIGSGITSTPLPEFRINRPTIIVKEQETKSSEKTKKENNSSTPETDKNEDFAPSHIGTHEDFERAKRELEEEIRRLQGE